MQSHKTYTYEDLVAIVARLRAPDGCPWDREQTHESVARNITEEAAETVDAIERGDLADLREELGDLLLQVLLQAQIADEAGEFTLDEVVDGIAAKLVRRHPHVFGSDAALAAIPLSDEARQEFADKIAAAADAEAVLRLWDNIKLMEREAKAQAAGAAAGAPAPTAGALTPTASAAAAGAAAGEAAGAPTPAPAPSLLDSVPVSLPALMQAQDVSRKAVSAGFDWPDVDAVWSQVAAEAAEFRAEPRGSAQAADEFGDILFALVNVAQKEGIDAESALRGTTRRFRRRWAIMEGYARQQGRDLSSYSVEEQEEFWQQAKAELQDSGDGGFAPHPPAEEAGASPCSLSGAEPPPPL